MNVQVQNTVDRPVPRAYRPDEVEQIITAYRELFPVSEITPALRSYWGLERKRPWSYITTDFHQAAARTLLMLHEESAAITARRLNKQAQGEALRTASQRLGVGFSIGVCPWTDNLLFETYKPRSAWHELIILVGHDWYPIGESPPLESPLWVQGLHHVPKYQRYCPTSFFGPPEKRPVILFLNFYPDFRRPGAPLKGLMPQRNNSLPYSGCMAGLKEILRILRPKFARTRIISWGTAWSAMSQLVDGGPITRKIVDQQNEATGEVLSVDGVPYFPMAHPSFGTNQNKAHLLSGYANLGLGLPEFAVKK